jgi:hypothetical protein
MRKLHAILLAAVCLSGLMACLPPADPYPQLPPALAVAQAQEISDSLEAYILRWTQGLAPDSIPDRLIPAGIEDSRDFYLKDPAAASAAETWAVRYARPIRKDSLQGGIPDPNVTYLFLGTALAPFGSKLVIEGEFPHCRFFSIQVSPPLNGREYYAQRQFGTAEVAIADADIEPLPGHTNPFRIGASRHAALRSYRLEIELAAGDPVALNPQAHQYPYRSSSNLLRGAMLVLQGPLGFKTVAGTPLPVPGDWNLGALWIRIYRPDDGTGPLGGVPMPRVYYELPNGARYFIGSNFSALQRRADATIANRVTGGGVNPYFGPDAGWYKSWGITRSMLSGICQVNGWSRRDSGARARAIDLGWTGRGEFQPAPGNIEPHATTNNYASYLGRRVTVEPGMVAVLTGKMPTFPGTRQGQAVMAGGQIRYWSVCGIDDDALSPMPATTIHAISDDEAVLDADRNYIIAYSRPGDRPANATAANGVSWVDWGTQSSMGLLMRWVSVDPGWTFPLAPQEHHLGWSRSDWAGTQYDSTLIGVNWRHGFMQCYLPQVHYMSRAEFEALGADLEAADIPSWVDSGFSRTGPAVSQLGSLSTSSALDASPVNQAFNANDGSLQTAWSSAFGQQQASVTLDLGRVRTISAVKLHWDWIFFAKDYAVRVSDDSLNWQVLAGAQGENGRVDLYPKLQGVSGRYVQLQLTRYNAGYYRLAEFEVYTTDCDCVPAATAAEALAPPVRLRIYPNPSAGALHYSLGELRQPARLEIYDLQGRLRQSAALQAASGRVDTGALPPGVYVAAVTDGSGRQAAVKWVKRR